MATRTTAPASLTASNSVAEAATTDAIPTAAKHPHASTPIELPDVVKNA